MKHISSDSGPTMLEEGEIVMVSMKGAEIPCKVIRCFGTSCDMCVINEECAKWDCRISEIKTAAFIPL